MLLLPHCQFCYFAVKHLDDGVAIAELCEGHNDEAKCRRRKRARRKKMRRKKMRRKKMKKRMKKMMRNNMMMNRALLSSMVESPIV